MNNNASCPNMELIYTTGWQLVIITQVYNCAWGNGGDYY